MIIADWHSRYYVAKCEHTKRAGAEETEEERQIMRANDNEDTSRRFPFDDDEPASRTENRSKTFRHVLWGFYLAFSLAITARYILSIWQGLDAAQQLGASADSCVLFLAGFFIAYSIDKLSHYQEPNPTRYRRGR